MSTNYIWLDLSDGPSPRYDHASATIGSTLFIFGGVDSQGSDLSDFWQYDSLSVCGFCCH